MLNPKQVPMLRVSARNAFEQQRLSAAEYNELIRYLDEIEMRSQIKLDTQTNKRASEFMLNRKLLFQH